MRAQNKKQIKMIKDKTLASSLRNYNIAVACVHASSFVALLIISIVNYDQARQSRQFYIDYPQREAGTYRLFYTLLPFPFITAIAHALAAAGAFNYYEDVLVGGVNALRWVEYSITNGLMTFSIAALVGYTDVTSLLLLLVANVLMQACGYAHELSNRVKRGTLFYLAVGFLPWIYKWTLSVLFLHTQQGDEVFDYDYVAVYGALGLSLTFVAPLVYKYTQLGKSANLETLNYRVEVAYLLLSLTAKLFLDWTITIGNLVHN